MTVKGGAILDMQDLGIIGTTTVDPDSRLITANLAAPVIDAAKITLSAHDHSFWVSGDVGAITDADGIANADAVNARTGDHVQLSVASDGSFAAVAVPGTSGDAITIQATDGHYHPRTSEAGVGDLPANAGPPSVDTNAITVSQVSTTEWKVTGAPGAVADPELPIAVAIADQVSGGSQAVEAGGDGSFSVTIAAALGDDLVLTATDGHPQAQSTQVDLGAAPGNAPPVIHTDGLHIRYAGPDGDHDSARYELQVDSGAITDDDPPIHLAVSSPTGESWSASIDSGGMTWIDLDSTELEPGMVLTLTATDSNASVPASTSVDLPPLPQNNYGPPDVDPSKIQVLPLGLGYQVIGAAGAVTDPDVPVTVTLTNTSSGWSSAAVSVRQDGSFWTRVPGSVGDSLSLVATDGHPQDPLSTDPQGIGSLPAAGLRADAVPLTVDSEEHTASLIRGALAVLDGGSGLGSLVLSSSRDDGEAEGLDNVVTGLSGVRDVIAPSGDADVLEGYALAGGSVLAWTGQWGCDDQGANCQPAAAEAHTISSDPLESGVAVNGWLYLVSGNSGGLTFHSLTEPTVTTDETAGTLTIDWGCVPDATSLAIDGTAGFTAVAAVPGPVGEIAVITDDPNDEIRFVDVTSPTNPVLAGSLDLPGSAAPTWASWDDGWLLLGRDDGSIEVWRWDDTGAEEIASWQSGAVPVGADLVGGELWVALSDGRLQQVRLDGSVPSLVGEAQIGGEIRSMSADGRSLVIVTDSGAVHEWMWELPPDLAPERVVWLTNGQQDDLFVDPEWLAVGQTCYVTWPDGATSRSTGAPPWPFFHTLPPPEGTPSAGEGPSSPANTPQLQIITDEGIPGRVYLPADWVAWESPNAAWLTGAHQWEPIARDCGRDRAATGSGWAAFASGGVNGIDYFAAAGPQGPASWQQLSTNGAVTALLGLGNHDGSGGTLYACAGDLEIWDLSNPAAPAAQQAIDLLGAAPIAAVAALSPPAGGLELAAVGGSPLEVAVVDLADPLNPAVIADQEELPGFSGSLERVAAASDALYVLANDGGAQKLYVYGLSDPSNPSLSATADVSGAAITAMAAGSWVSQQASSEPISRVAIARADGTIDLFDGASLTALDTIRLPAVPRDLATESDGDSCTLYIALGEGYGVAEVELGSPVGPDLSPYFWYAGGGIFRLIRDVRGWLDGMLTESGEVLGEDWGGGVGPVKGKAERAREANAGAVAGARRARRVRTLTKRHQHRERRGWTRRSQLRRGW